MAALERPEVRQLGDRFREFMTYKRPLRHRRQHAGGDRRVRDASPIARSPTPASTARCSSAPHADRRLAGQPVQQAGRGRARPDPGTSRSRPTTRARCSRSTTSRCSTCSRSRTRRTPAATYICEDATPARSPRRRPQPTARRSARRSRRRLAAAAEGELQLQLGHESSSTLATTPGRRRVPREPDRHRRLPHAPDARGARPRAVPQAATPTDDSSDTADPVVDKDGDLIRTSTPARCRSGRRTTSTTRSGRSCRRSPTTAQEQTVRRPDGRAAQALVEQAVDRHAAHEPERRTTTRAARTRSR